MDVILNNGTIKPVFSLQGDISLAGEVNFLLKKYNYFKKRHY